MLPLLCSMSLISPNFDVKWIIFPTFGQEPFHKTAEKSPAGKLDIKRHSPSFPIY